MLDISLILMKKEYITDVRQTITKTLIKQGMILMTVPIVAVFLIHLTMITTVVLRHN